MNASLPGGELFTAISMRTKPKIVAKKPSATSMKTALTGDAYNRPPWRFCGDYFRGHPSALRAAGLSGARCGRFGEADARLITIGELDAGRLECTL